MVEAFENTRAFIKAAVADGAHLKKPERVAEDRWVRDMNMLVSYYASPTATYQGLAESYEFKKPNRERPRQIIETCLQRLYANCSPLVQQDYDLSQLHSKKPFTLEQSVRRLRIRGGTTAEIVSLASQGKTAEEIKKAGYTSRELGEARWNHARLGMKIPYIRQSCVESPLLLEALQEETDPEKIKKLFTRISAYFYKVHARGENPLFLTAKELFLQAGIHYYKKVVSIYTLIKPLEEADKPIPFGSVTRIVKSGPQKGSHVYYFTLTKFQEPAIRILKTHPDLEQFRINPVVQVFGPPAEKYPSTTEFGHAQSSGDYLAVNSLLVELGVARVGGYGFTLEEFLAGCDVQIFRYPPKGSKYAKGSYVYHIGQKDALTRFILDRKPRI